MVLRVTRSGPLYRPPLFHPFDIPDADCSALCTALTVGKDKFDPEVTPVFVRQAGEHPHTV
ncbi:hypothetical protein QUF90_23295 [Desulfococcaceae bacterium HSG9]|nr:hypothetical protein [Desulfococcaceae bacterium HSG9]